MTEATTRVHAFGLCPREKALRITDCLYYSRDTAQYNLRSIQKFGFLVWIEHVTRYVDIFTDKIINWMKAIITIAMLHILSYRTNHCHTVTSCVTVTGKN